MSKVTGLGHVGIFVQDLEKMLDFYTRVLGLTVTDGGEPGARGVFLSARPEAEHHEFVMARVPERATSVQQISFTTGTLDDLRNLHHAITDYGCQVNRVVNHGIAFGCYFNDPEGNNIEVYWSTGMDYPQPVAEPIDLGRSNDELLAGLRGMEPREATAGHLYGEDVGKRLAPSGHGS